MNLIKMAFLALVLGLFAAGSLPAQGGKPQTVCPVFGGNIDRNIYVDYKGQRIYFCCPGCDAEFKKDPEKYMKKIQEQGITLEKCPEEKK